MNSFSRVLRIASGLSALGALSLTISCGSPPKIRPVSDVKVNFAERQTYALTGGDTQAAGLTGFQRDSFGDFFAGAIHDILAQRGLREVGASQIDSAGYIIRFILRDKLIITALDPLSKRLIWRGQSEREIDKDALTQAGVVELVEQAISGFPPGR